MSLVIKPFFCGFKGVLFYKGEKFKAYSANRDRLIKKLEVKAGDFAHAKSILEGAAK
jgi:hypothetical protein